MAYASLWQLQEAVVCGQHGRVQAKVRTCPSRAQPASAPPCVLALLSVLVSRAAWASVGGRHSLARALQNETRGIRRAFHPYVSISRYGDWTNSMYGIARPGWVHTREVYGS